MNKAFLIAAAAAFTIASCQSAPKADEALVAGAQTAATEAGARVAIDTTSSTITWVGTKPTGQHTGTFALDSGYLAVNGGNLAAGAFTIDVASLNSTDLEGEYKQKLDGHLKSADFFDVEQHPTARFEITKVEPFDSSRTTSLLPGATHLISGNLTLKGQTRNVTFPAVVDLNGNAVSAKANFNINRADWGMSYGNDQSLQDKFIRPEVNIQLDIKTQQ